MTQKIYFGNTELKQIEKGKAKKLYEHGKRIYVIPNKANPNYGSYIDEHGFKHAGVWWGVCNYQALQVNFDELIRCIIRNTDKELGTYLKYYIELESEVQSNE